MNANLRKSIWARFLRVFVSGGGGGNDSSKDSELA